MTQKGARRYTASITMSFTTKPSSMAWQDYNTQRERRYHLIPKLIRISRAYLKESERPVSTLTAAHERARQMKEFGFSLIGEQFEAEKDLTKAVRAFLIQCHHHHALLARTDFCEIHHDLIDAEAHLSALSSIIIGYARPKRALV